MRYSMYDIARLPSEEREILFKNTAAKKGLPEAIIALDYSKMQSMIYGDAPSFDEMLFYIKTLEKEINEAKF